MVDGILHLLLLLVDNDDGNCEEGEEQEGEEDPVDNQESPQELSSLENVSSVNSFNELSVIFGGSILSLVVSINEIPLGISEVIS
jgi:hypothetical protein